jgi:RNA-directed DNA polymerase
VADGGPQAGVLCRYADELVVVCPTRERAEQARDLVAVLDRLGLRLHPDKTRIVHLRKGAEGFDFLGFHLRKCESWRRPGKWWLLRWPSERAMAAIRAKGPRADHPQPRPSAHERGRGPSQPRATRLGQLLPLRQLAWKFSAVDSYVRMRLAQLASTKHRRPGRNWPAGYNYAWSKRLGVYWLVGTVRSGAVHASR